MSSKESVRQYSCNRYEVLHLLVGNSNDLLGFLVDYVSYLGGDTALSLYLFNFVFSTIDKY